jgi:hypothetical protein
MESPAELSAVVADLDEALESCELTVIQQGMPALSASEPTRQLSGLNHLSRDWDFGPDLGLGR